MAEVSPDMVRPGNTALSSILINAAAVKLKGVALDWRDYDFSVGSRRCWKPMYDDALELIAMLESAAGMETTTAMDRYLGTTVVQQMNQMAAEAQPTVDGCA